MTAHSARPPQARPGLSAALVGEGGAGLGAITVMVVWLMCLAVGTAGLLLPYPRPHPLVEVAPPVHTRFLNVRLTDAPPPPPAAAPPPRGKPGVAGGPSAAPASPANASTPPGPAAPPEAPALPAVAQSKAAVAFAVPVEGLTRLVDVKHAEFARPAQPISSTPAPASAAGLPGGNPGGVAGGSGGVGGTGSGSGVATTAPAVETLTYGQGAGAQPAPAYPRDAVVARQEGTVGIRFRVGGDGRVLAAKVYAACHWPLLNQAALRAVRDTWLFPPGLEREYQVVIDFQLTQK